MDFRSLQIFELLNIRDQDIFFRDDHCIKHNNSFLQKSDDIQPSIPKKLLSQVQSCPILPTQETTDPVTIFHLIGICEDSSPVECCDAEVGGGCAALEVEDPLERPGTLLARSCLYCLWFGVFLCETLVFLSEVDS